ncbi:hypothetical protein AB4Z46_24040 [Variovorax sp. M-6]|uniref:hypothetical protein n=1 Tax=Variovorax sp. M-6 TaxID=3233041 RepID=UPI003F9BC0B5
MKIARVETHAWSAPRTLRGGFLRFKYLLEGEEGSPDNFALTVVDTDQSFKSPRHRHNFDQIRVTLSGSTNYGPKQNIAVGDVAYFPEATYYGPQDQELVGSASVAMVIQFGGASGNGYMSARQMLEAQQRLQSAGRFEGGVFHREAPAQGERKNQDSYEATWEEHNGRQLEYPAPRLTDPVHFRADNIPWVPVRGAEGTYSKELGVFTERNVRLGAIRLEAGARYTLPLVQQGRLLFFTTGTGKICTTDSWSAHSAVHLCAGETMDLSAENTSEALILAMPYFGKEEVCA